jgi:glycosyltransferase involved in cell wall biosynthesis
MSIEAPTVTIGIPSYQCAAFIGEAIASVLAQDFTDLELLIVDDASTDGTVEVIAGFDDPRIRVLHNETNIGPGRNWNRLLDEARGRYVKVMGCDDVLLPDSLGAQVAVLESDPDIVLVTGPRLLVTESGRRLMRRGNAGFVGRVSGLVAARQMVRHGSHLVGEPVATLMRVSTAHEAGHFDESEPYCIDMEMWFRLFELGDLYVLEQPVSKYRIVETSWSTTVAETQYDDVAELLRSAAARPALGVTQADLAVGLRRAKRLAFARGLVYRALFDVEMRRRFLYLVVGGWNTLFGYLAFSALYYLLHASLGYVPVFILSYTLAILNAYWGYKLVVFRTSTSFRKEFPRFAIVYVVALAANLVVFPWLTQTLGLNPYLSQAVFTVALIVATYIVNKRFSFRQGPA